MKKIFSILFSILMLHSFAQTNEFWGVTTKGGASDNGGTIFSTKDDGTNLQTRYSFPINNVGAGPDRIQLTPYNGKLYGTTGNGGKFDKGVIFSYDPVTNIYNRLYDFDYTTGANPNTNLTLVNGKFYGTTRIGGSASLTSLGVIYEFDPTTLVYTKKIEFTGTSGVAMGNLAIGSMVSVGGKLYGTTSSGGLNNAGVLFEYNPSTNLYVIKRNFLIPSGTGLQGNLTEYNNKLYGTCVIGGANSVGVIFEFDLVTNVYTVKYNMLSATGANPAVGVIVFNNKLYGANQYGGTNSRGSIFEFDLATSTYQIVYNFTQTGGAFPASELYLYNNIFYSFTLGGGSNSLGVIFKFDPATYTYTKTYDFPGPLSPSNYCSFINYNNTLYATTKVNNEINNAGGTILSYNPSTDSYTKKLVLNSYSLMGNAPTAKLLYYNSKIYGSTVYGGANNSGVVFEFNPATNVYTKLLDLSVTTTGTNLGPLIVKNGILYGNMQFYQPAVGSNRGGIFAYNLTNSTYTVCSFNTTTFSEPKGQLVDNNDGTLTGITTSRPGVSTSAGGVFKYNIASNTINSFVQNVPTANGNFLQDIRLFNNSYYILGATTNNSDDGSIMENSLSGSFNTRATFNVTSTGTRPTGFLTPFNGKLYCVSSTGLNNNLNKQGTIVEYDPLPPYTLTRKYEFLAASGHRPTTGFLLYNNKFYGLTQTGGTTGYDPVGVLYEFDPITNVYTQKTTFNYANGASPDIAALIALPTGAPLPIKLTSFVANEKAGNTYLEWATSYEFNNKGYYIQHSVDGVTFTNIGFVNSKGNSTLNTNYIFTDNKPAFGKNYYRLQQVDIDGKITYSNIVIVIIKNSKKLISIYPNPTSKIINIASGDKIISIELFDISGRKIKSYTAAETIVDLGMHANGMYTLRVMLSSGEKVEEKIILKK
jgi:uncharacterized repeat protein (TIGR03803 family)